MARKIFNPLDSISESSAQESTSKFINDKPGICPKCGQSMSTATIANGDSVYFCEDDFVSAPMLDEL